MWIVLRFVCLYSTNDHVGALTDFEVLKIIQHRHQNIKATNTNIDKNEGNELFASHWTYDQVKDYFDDKPCMTQKSNNVSDCFNQLNKYALSKLEILQLINIRPSEATLHAIITKCGTRFNQSQIDSLLKILHTSLEPPKKQQDSDDEDDEDEDDDDDDDLDTNKNARDKQNGNDNDFKSNDDKDVSM